VQGEDEVRETAVGEIIGCDKQLLNVVEREGEEEGGEREDETDKVKAIMSPRALQDTHSPAADLPPFLLQGTPVANICRGGGKR
jgi:hypothetical protein